MYIYIYNIIYIYSNHCEIGLFKEKRPASAAPGPACETCSEHLELSQLHPGLRKPSEITPFAGRKLEKKWFSSHVSWHHDHHENEIE